MMLYLSLYSVGKTVRISASFVEPDAGNTWGVFGFHQKHQMIYTNMQPPGLFASLHYILAKDSGMAYNCCWIFT